MFEQMSLNPNLRTSGSSGIVRQPLVIYASQIAAVFEVCFWLSLQGRCSMIH